MSIQSNVLRKNDLCPSRPEWDAALEAVRCGHPVILKDDAYRVRTIRAAIHPDARPQDLASPGHVFPLRAHPDGIRGRRWHTEGSVELARLAGLAPAVVLCELMNPDGSMARGADIARFAALHELPVIIMEDVLGMVNRQWTWK